MRTSNWHMTRTRCSCRAGSTEWPSTLDDHSTSSMLWSSPFLISCATRCFTAGKSLLMWLKSWRITCLMTSTSHCGRSTTISSLLPGVPRCSSVPVLCRKLTAFMKDDSASSLSAKNLVIMSSRKSYQLIDGGVSSDCTMASTPCSRSLHVRGITFLRSGKRLRSSMLAIRCERTASIVLSSLHDTACTSPASTGWYMSSLLSLSMTPTRNSSAFSSPPERFTVLSFI
mmetsp:Transcript_36308/g.114602  ORF Transcript_36308/g.114602 Transcript_36308/m.114602 type:complete len:228 (-) Transcript_36308:2701-3384(-)